MSSFAGHEHRQRARTGPALHAQDGQLDPAKLSSAEADRLCRGKIGEPWPTKWAH